MSQRSDAADHPATGPVTRPNTRQRWLFVGKLGLTALYVWYVLRLADIRVLAQTIAAADWMWYLLALAVWMIAMVANSIRWSILSRPLDLPTGLGNYVSLYLIGSFFNTFLPTLIGGDLVKAYYLTRGTQLRAASTTSVVMDRVVGVGGLLVVGTVASLANPVELGSTPIFPIMLAMVMAYVLICAVVLSARFHKQTVSLLERLGLSFVAERFFRLFRSLGVYRAHIRRLVLMLLLSSLVHLLSYVAIFIIGISIGADIPLYYYLIFIPIVAIITMLPISIGGLGIRETAFLTLFASAGLSAEQSVGLSILWYAMMCLGGLPGLVLYLARRK